MAPATTTTTSTAPPASSSNPLDNYEVLEVIGTGSFGKIRKVRRKSDGKLLARKEINYIKMSDKEKMQLVSEVNILRELRHPNIVRYYEGHVDKDSGVIYIYMEYWDGGDLGSFLRRCKKENRVLEEEAIWRVFAQLVLALNECHHRVGPNGANVPPVLHRDLKPENVLLDSSGGVKLGDFGLSRTLEGTSNPSNAQGSTDSKGALAKTFVGTPYYMSPELLQGQGYNTKSDVWSLGCVIYEMCALQPPFEAPNQTVLASRIRSAPLTRIPTHYTEDLNRVIASVLNKDQFKRPSVCDLLNVPAIQKHAAKAKSMHQQQQQQERIRREEEARRKSGKAACEEDSTRRREEDPARRREEELQAREEAVRRKEEDQRRRDQEQARRDEELRRREEEIKRREEDIRRREEEVVSLRSKAYAQGFGTIRRPLHGMPDKENATSLSVPAANVASADTRGSDRPASSNGTSAAVGSTAAAVERRRITGVVGAEWWGVRA